MAVTKPVTKVSGLAKGISHGASALWSGNDLKTSLAVAKEAAARREREIAEELGRAGRAAHAAAGREVEEQEAPGYAEEPVPTSPPRDWAEPDENA
jgi:hypothetical protein